MSRLVSLSRTLPSASRLAPQLPQLQLPRRFASSGQSAPRRFLSTTLLLGGGLAFVAYYYDSRSVLHEHVVMPLVRLVDPETGHKLAVRLLSGPSWARPSDRGVDGPELRAEVFGLDVKNPIGMAAGFDKDAQAIDGLFDLGFGYVEIGSVTPEPQPGNPQPRFFRLEEDAACINRYGFNSLGHGHALGQLRARIHSLVKSNPSLFPSPLPPNPLPPSSLPRSLRPGQILAVNLGKNKTSAADSNDDYVKGVRTLGPYADVVVINVSSPNTPGLRALQGREILYRLLKEVVEERNKIEVGGLPKIAVKVACDLNEDELGDIAAAVRKSGVDGVIISNTTVRRDGLGLESANQSQVGGLSGRPLFPLALDALRTLRPLLPASIPIIGCGGISTGTDALQMGEAGASLVQIYTSFGYRGVGTPRLLKDELSQALHGETWKGVVGRKATTLSGNGSTDESRLQKEGDVLRREARELAELLRDLSDKEDTQRLVLEAESALRGKVAGSGESETTPATAAPRDNALGSETVESSQQQARIEATPAPAPTPLLPRAQESVLVQAVPAIELEPGVQHTGIDLRTIIVPDEPEPTQPSGRDEWERTVRGGPRRLV